MGSCLIKLSPDPPGWESIWTGNSACNTNGGVIDSSCHSPLLWEQSSLELIHSVGIWQSSIGLGVCQPQKIKDSNPISEGHFGGRWRLVIVRLVTTWSTGTLRSLIVLQFSGSQLLHPREKRLNSFEKYPNIRIICQSRHGKIVLFSDTFVFRFVPRT